MFDFPQPGVGNSGALCEVVRSLRPKTAPFFADPWQQICGNDIVSCWVITHNSDCHILQSLGKKWRGEKKKEKKELHWSTRGKWPEKCLQPEELYWKKNHSCRTVQWEQLFYSSLIRLMWHRMATAICHGNRVVYHSWALWFSFKNVFFFLMIIAFSLGLLKQVWLFNKSCGFKWLKPFEPI